MTTVIDRAAALRGLRSAVAERGEAFVYQSPTKRGECWYTHQATQQPGCQVGLALHKLGVPLDALRSLDSAAGNLGSVGARVLSRPQYRAILGDVVVTEEAAQIFSAAQVVQDRGEAWGRALGAAEQRALTLEATAVLKQEQPDLVAA